MRRSRGPVPCGIDPIQCSSAQVVIIFPGVPVLVPVRARPVPTLVRGCVKVFSARRAVIAVKLIVDSFHRCTCVSASARQSRAQCCAREFCCKILSSFFKILFHEENPRRRSFPVFVASHLPGNPVCTSRARAREQGKKPIPVVRPTPPHKPGNPVCTSRARVNRGHALEERSCFPRTKL